MMTWKQELNRYLTYQKARDTTETYIGMSRRYLTELGEAYNLASYLDLTQEQLVEWFTRLSDRLKPISLKAIRSIITTCFRYLNGNETPDSLKGLPRGRVRHAYRVKAKTDLLTQKDLRRIWQISSPDKEIIFRLLYYSGARPNEVLHLTRKDLDFRQLDGVQVLELSFRETKTGNPRTVPIIDGETITKVREFLDVAPESGYLFPSTPKPGQPLSHRGLWRYLKRKGKQLGIDKNLYPYLFRHTRATELHDAPPAIRDRIMGWESPMQWKAYTHLVTDDATKYLLKEAKVTQDPEKILLQFIKDHLEDNSEFRRVMVEWIRTEKDDVVIDDEM